MPVGRGRRTTKDTAPSPWSTARLTTLFHKLLGDLPVARSVKCHLYFNLESASPCVFFADASGTWCRPPLFAPRGRSKRCLGARHNNYIRPENAQSPSPSHHRTATRGLRNRDADADDKTSRADPYVAVPLCLIHSASSIFGQPMCYCARPTRWDEKGRGELLSTAFCRNSTRESLASFVFH